MVTVLPAGHGEPAGGRSFPARFPGRQENPIMTAETPSATAPARPARSLAGTAPPPGKHRPSEDTASVPRGRARTSADPAVIHLVTRARTGGTRARDELARSRGRAHAPARTPPG